MKRVYVSFTSTFRDFCEGKITQHDLLCAGKVLFGGSCAGHVFREDPDTVPYEVTWQNKDLRSQYGASWGEPGVWCGECGQSHRSTGAWRGAVDWDVLQKWDQFQMAMRLLRGEGRVVFGYQPEDLHKLMSSGCQVFRGSSEMPLVRSAQRYRDDTILVEMYTRDGYYQRLSTNVEGVYEELLQKGHDLKKDSFLAKTWSENSYFAKEAYKSGRFVDTGLRIPTQFGEAPVWKIAEVA